MRILARGKHPTCMIRRRTLANGADAKQQIRRERALFTATHLIAVHKSAAPPARLIRRISVATRIILVSTLSVGGSGRSGKAAASPGIDRHRLAGGFEALDALPLKRS